MARRPVLCWQQINQMNDQIKTVKQGNFSFNYFPGYIEIRHERDGKIDFVHTVTNENERRVFVSAFREGVYLATAAVQKLV